MTAPARLDVLAIGNAIVDVIADADDAFLEDEGLTKGSMRLIDAEEATRLYAHMGQAARSAAARPATPRRASRRSAAAPASSARSRPTSSASSIIHDIRATGVEFTTAAGRFRGADRALPGAGHARRAPDDEHLPRRRPILPAEALDEAQIEGAAILYLEGYLWDPETPRYAMVKAIDVARQAGRQVAFTLSDTFCIDRHRDGFNQLIDGGRIDILFANEAEIQALAGAAAFRKRGRGGEGQGEDPGRDPQREGRDRASRAASAPKSPAEPVETRSSTRPAPAICSPPASSPARRRARSLEQTPADRRDRRRRGDLALRRPARGGPQGAGRRSDSARRSDLPAAPAARRAAGAGTSTSGGAGRLRAAARRGWAGCVRLRRLRGLGMGFGRRWRGHEVLLRRRPNVGGPVELQVAGQRTKKGRPKPPLPCDSDQASKAG